jgi:hypothetical protein
MTAPRDRDDELMQALAEAMRGLGEPPTARDLAAARSARDRVGATNPWNVAELAFDSLFDRLLEVRGPAAVNARRLAFYANDVTVSLDVGVDLLACHVTGAEPVAVSVVAAADDRYPMLQLGGGEYELTDPPRGTVRLELDVSEDTVVTDWFRL